MLTEAQKESRKQGLGATDCAVVMGLSPYKTRYELWLEKTGQSEDQPILSDDRLHLRHAHEETIAREYARRNNVKLRRVNQTVYHKRLPFMFCNLDRVIIGQKKIVECKSYPVASCVLLGASPVPMRHPFTTSCKCNIKLHAVSTMMPTSQL